jgi:hypothetical protein
MRGASEKEQHTLLFSSLCVPPISHVTMCLRLGQWIPVLATPRGLRRHHDGYVGVIAIICLNQFCIR